MEIKYNEKGLVPVVVQDVYSKDVLMVAYANQEALNMTLKTKKAHYFSRSRNELWLKGETSGNYQEVREILVDCDADTLIYLVVQTGVACHTGNRTCFFEKVFDDLIEESNNAAILGEVYKVVCDRKQNPKEGSYTNYLFDKGIDKILKKVGEESAETIIAAKNDVKEEIALEVSDLLYHIIVMLVDRGMSLDDIYKELEHRR